GAAGVHRLHRHAQRVGDGAGLAGEPDAAGDLRLPSPVRRDRRDPRDRRDDRHRHRTRRGRRLGRRDDRVMDPRGDPARLLHRVPAHRHVLHARGGRPRPARPAQCDLTQPRAPSTRTRPEVPNRKETPTVSISTADVIVTSPGRNFVTLKIVTSDGIVGWGDATLNGRELAVASYLRDHLASTLVGRDEDRIEDTWQYLYRGAYWRRGPVTMAAIAAVDMALWDIKAKKAGVPLYQLLGGASRDKLRVYAHASG